MISDIPIIKTFVYEKKFYCYDANTNFLVEISKELYKELQELQTIGKNAYIVQDKNIKAYNEVLNLMQKGFFESEIVKKIAHIQTKNIEILSNRAVNQLILGITNACNFKCRYCHQAEGKLLSNKERMSKGIAFKSIDFLYDHSKDAKYVSISFYGGEPLLNFPLIVESVQYANSKFKSKKVSYNLTTNASLLNDKIIDFFYRNNFNLLISLDGNEDIQNRHRRLLKNGGDTFNIVYKNIARIREKYPKYFEEEIGFNAVLFEDDDPDAAYAFFQNNGFNSNYLSIKRADMMEIDYTYSPILLKQNANNKYINKILDEDFLKKINNKNKIANIWHHNGPCVAGIRRIYVNAEGNIYTCEKVDSDDSCKIGTLDSGFNISKMKEIMNIGKLTEEECKKCWGLRFCSICAYLCVDKGSFSKEKKLFACNNSKKEALTYFKKCIKSHGEN